MSKRKHRRRRRGARAELPRNVRSAFELGAGLFAELQEGGPIEDAIARRRRELRELIAPFDAIHLLGHVVFSEAPIDPETYKESEHPGAAFVVEMVAADLLVRPGRAGTSEITPAIDARVSQPIRRLCREAAHLESIRRMRAAGGLSTPESSARARAASHHLMLRGPGWPWQEHETLRGLFGAERFAVRVREALGFDVEDAIACSEALPHLVMGRLEAHMVAARESAVDFGEEHPAYRWATAALQGWQEAGPERIRALAITALWALNRVGDVLLLDQDSLATAAAVDPTIAAEFLSKLSQPPGQADDDWFRMAEAVRFHPFINYGADGYMPTVIGNELWALRGVFEHALAKNDPYTRHRGRWLERRAGELLAQPLAPEHVHFSVDLSTTTTANGSRARSTPFSFAAIPRSYRGQRRDHAGGRPPWR